MATKTLKSTTKAPAGESLLVFRDQKEWASWLNEHHKTSPGIWMRIGKKGSALESLSYAEALEAALCYGWIDGQKRAYDDASWLQRFTPRGPNSVWSRINRDKADDLIRSGRMKPAGLDAIERRAAERTLGLGLRLARPGSGLQRLSDCAESKPQSQEFLLNPRSGQPLRHSLADSDRQAGRDPGQEDSAVHPHAGEEGKAALLISA
jgi:hypothetical protein